MKRSSGKKRGRRTRLYFAWGYVVLAVSVIFLFASILIRYGGVLKERAVEEAAPEAPAERVPVRVAGPGGPRVAIVIDDMGHDRSRLTEIISLDMSITVAVLPGRRFSEEIAESAYAAGLEVIVHLPMEPVDSEKNDPGDGALYTRMTPEEVRSGVIGALRGVPHATGVNNHMGSLFTSNERLMREVIEVVRERGIFFLDSRTTPGSVGYSLTREMGARGAARSVFLDNERKVDYITERLDELVRIAGKNGSAIAIGHPYPETIEALRKAVPAIEARGVRVVRLSELID